MPEKKPSVAMLKDTVTGEEIPAFLGGDPVTDDSATTSEDRGDSIEPAKASAQPADAPEEKAEEASKVAETEATKKAAADAEEAGVGDGATEQAAEPPAQTEKSPIPYSRFKEVNDAKKAAQAELEAAKRELEELRKQKAEPKKEEPPAPPAYDFDGKETEYVNLILEGKTEDAVKLRKEINFERDKITRGEVEAAQRKAREGATQDISIEQTKQKVEALAEDYAQRYAELDGNSDETLNEEAVGDLKAFYTANLDRGQDPVEAFKAAVEKTVRLYGFKDRTVKEPAKEPAKKEAQKEVARKKAIANAQPIQSAGVGSSGGSDTDEFNPETMTDAQLAALPAATLARLRGDFI